MEIDNILKLDELNSELEFERATIIYGKLRWMVEEDSSLEPIRQHLRFLIMQHEEKHWNDELKISKEQIAESDIAEKIVSLENGFIQNRKDLIPPFLKEEVTNHIKLTLKELKNEALKRKVK